ncbi:DUF1778 domain-containing protein [Chitinophaga filiformis]|uniref:type II toxin-antitoxin system TacA family antitoxin n=1 Tax=Chitinophaga filiformis TaxID=104663 RepID=UPI001F3978D3|nr:DUF1778 domain-containing protein [Chitinophaga filiformis]MCF6405610.1 DUF1778 domain-containing protein [Chitinophaga filiformis]
MKSTGMTRFDTRLSTELKQYFEHAADLGGFKTLSEFVIFSVKAQAEKIIEKHNAILASQRDQEVFFDAIMNPGKPNKSLKEAAARYKRLSKEK